MAYPLPDADAAINAAINACARCARVHHAHDARARARDAHDITVNKLSQGWPHDRISAPHQGSEILVDCV